jgi:feruloyl esterase
MRPQFPRFFGPLFFASALSVFGSADCGQLTALAITNTSVTSAVQEQGSCRVKLAARPVTDSEIHIEVWLPDRSRWNGKFLGTGNGGYSSAMSLAAMQTALEQGYAVAGSDTGHEGGDLSFGAGHPEKIDDWGYRAIHVMTETAAVVVRNYYGRFAEKSYFSGCSTGGHQALMEAQRFPEDYDGIVAGDPGNNRVRLNIGFLWSWQATHEGAGLPAAKLPMLNAAVVAACDRLDGVADGLISDPRKCTFDPGKLLCSGAGNERCLTAAEVNAVQKVYQGARNPRTGEQIYPGWERGSEAGWGGYFAGQSQPARVDFWRLWVFRNPAWEAASFDYDRDVAFSDRQMASLVANNPDLSAFQRRKGKLLLYHGWADPVVPPEDTLRYYDSVVRAMGAAASADFMRLFMLPGMGHCGGGPGPNTFDAVAALDAWAASGEAPAQIVATHSGRGVARTRPVCAWPEIAKPKSTGPDEPVFACPAGDPAR